MPPVVAIGGAIAGAAAGAAVTGAAVTAGVVTAGSIAAGLIGAAVTGVVTIGTSMLGNALFKPKQPDAGAFAAKAQNRLISTLSSVDTHKIIYGRVRTAGTIVFRDSTDGTTVDNQFLHQVQVLAGHEVEEIETIYIDETPVTLDADGFVTNSRWVKDGIPLIRVLKYTGSPSQTASSQLASASARWTMDHRLRGLAYIYIRFRGGDNGFPNGVPNISAIVKGKKVYDPRTATTAYSNNWALCVRDYITSGNNTGNYSYGLGASSSRYDDTNISAAANICDELADISNQTRTFTPSDVSTSADTITLNTPLFENGEPVQISTTGTLPSGISAATDYYIRVSQYGIVTLHTTRRGALENTGKVNITSTGSGVHTMNQLEQVRYTCDGIIDTADNPIDILTDLKTAAAGAIVYVQGKWMIYAGAYNSSVATLDTSWLAGPIDVQATTPKSELFNAVKGVFINPAKRWQSTDFPPIKNTTYQTQDGGTQLYKDIELPFTTHRSRARRIAKIALEKSRQGIVVKMPCNFKALQLTVWDNVSLTFDQLGWSSKVFRVTEWEFNPDGSGLILTLNEESSDSYDWIVGDDSDEDLAPDTNLPEANVVLAPSGLTVTESLYVTYNAAGVKAKATLNWTASTTLSVLYYAVQFKLSNAIDWNNANTVVGNTSTTTEILDIPAGVYDLRIRAVTQRGAVSDWTQVTQEIFGLTAAPSALTGFSLNAIHNQAHLRWDQSTDVDVQVGGSIRLRWSALTSGATWVNGIDIAPALPGVATNAVVPLLDGTYMIKAVDSSGNESAMASISSAVANVVNMNIIIDGTQDPSFPGTKTNMAADATAGILKLDSATLWDDISPSVNIDDWVGNIDDANGTGTASSGEYLFSYNGAPYFDLGAVYTSRVTALINSVVYDTGIVWDNLFPGIDIDSWPGNIDGDEISGTTVDLYIATTNDNPSGSPTWSDWRKFVVGDYEARAYKAKLVVTNTVESNNIDISDLGIAIDVPDRLESFLAQAIAGGGTTITWSKPFFAKPEVGIAISSPTSGDTPNITHNLSGGKYVSATVQVLNGGAGVARTVDVYVRGY